MSENDANTFLASSRTQRSCSSGGLEECKEKCLLCLREEAEELLEEVATSPSGDYFYAGLVSYSCVFTLRKKATKQEG